MRGWIDVFGSSLVSSPAGADSLFFVLPKKSKQKKGAPEMATHPLNFRNRAETGKTRCAQTVSRLVSARLRKFKAPSRAGTSTAKPLVCVPEWHLLVAVLLALLRVVLLVPTALVVDGVAVGALDGALNFCCREEKGRETV